MSYPIIFEMFKSGDCSKLYSKECYFHTMKLSNSLRFNVLVDSRFRDTWREFGLVSRGKN